MKLMWVWVCVHVGVYLVCGQGQMPAYIYSSQWSMYCFPHRVVSSLPIPSREQVSLSFSLLPSYNQYRWDHLDLNKHRSVCVLYACMDWVCWCLCVRVRVASYPVPISILKVGLEMGIVYETSVGVCTCGCVFVCVYKTDVCIAFLSLWSV